MNTVQIVGSAIAIAIVLLCLVIVSVKIRVSSSPLFSMKGKASEGASSSPLFSMKGKASEEEMNYALHLLDVHRKQQKHDKVREQLSKIFFLRSIKRNSLYGNFVAYDFSKSEDECRVYIGGVEFARGLIKIESLTTEVIHAFREFQGKHLEELQYNNFNLKVYRANGYFHIELTYSTNVIIFSDRTAYFQLTDDFSDVVENSLGHMLVADCLEFVGNETTTINIDRPTGQLTWIVNSHLLVTDDVSDTKSIDLGEVTGGVQRTTTPPIDKEHLSLLNDPEMYWNKPTQNTKADLHFSIPTTFKDITP